MPTPKPNPFQVGDTAIYMGCMYTVRAVGYRQADGEPMVKLNSYGWFSSLGCANHRTVAADRAALALAAASAQIGTSE